MRYGIHLYGKVRTTEEDTTQGVMGEIQKAQNKMLRLLNNSRIKDKICTKSIMANQAQSKFGKMRQEQEHPK